MLRYLLWICCFGLLVFGCAELVQAQANTWPQYPVDPQYPDAINRGPGSYFSWVKLVLVIALYLLWVKTTDWANRDCQILGLPYSVWNPVIVFPFVVGLLLVLTIPMFAAGFGLLFLSYAIPMGVYVFKRNSTVELHERVLTPSHMRHMLAGQMGKMGVDMGSEGKAAHEKGAPVNFTAMGGTEQQNQANIIWARQSPGYLPAKELVSEAIRQRADKVMLDFTRDAVAIRFQIDGVWHEAEGQDRESGDNVLAVFKKMGNLNVDERRKRQVGRFKAELEKRAYMGMIISQGTQTGERVIIQLDRPSEDFKSLRELGMRDKMEDQVRKLLQSDHGMFIMSALPAGGLTTTSRLVLAVTDRFTRDFVAFQDENQPEPLVQNIDLTTFNSAKGDVPFKMLETLLRKEPNVVVVNELPNPECAQLLCEQAADDKLVITTVRAKESVEALLRVLLLKVPPGLFARSAIGVLNQRLVRRLCDECKQAYEPTPQLLQKLGIPAGRIEHLYRTPEPSEQEKTCLKCNGIGYYGRTSIYELLVVDDKLRAALEKSPKLEVLRQVARQGGNRTLQQEGIVLVAQGVTSVQELSRVLKQ
ncbi:MAG: Flp pilus assembly complex ATPase component TadA [Planctomycetales bacterium]|nr:Flp pilus assembly complex ATPase component TadA [Planctomycetales bacterium]MCA9168653.1 Flp pilus assembly complex ATPase component TadA [Planctomycetales bacterium]